MTSFWCKVASVHADRALPVIFDLILNPLMDPAEMEKEREVILDELRMTNDYPAQVCDLLIDRALWPDQAMGRDVGGTAESVAAIQPGRREPVHGAAVPPQQHRHRHRRRSQP